MGACGRASGPRRHLRFTPGSMADGAAPDAMFKDKDVDVDWDLVLKLKEDGAVSKLQQAAKNQDTALEDLVREADKQFSAVCSFRVNKDDAKADVANLAYLFEFTQALLEIKTLDLKKTKADADKFKERYKAGRQDIKEYEKRISEQDDEIEKLLSQLQDSVASPTKKSGDATRSDADLKNLQKTLESTKERLQTVERERDDEKAKARELQDKERKAQSEKDELQRNLDSAEAELERMQFKQQEDAKRETTNRKNAQQAQRATYKFVKEVADLNEKVCACAPHPPALPLIMPPFVPEVRGPQPTGLIYLLQATHLRVCMYVCMYVCVSAFHVYVDAKCCAAHST